VRFTSLALLVLPVALTACGSSESAELPDVSSARRGVELVHQIGSIDESDEALTRVSDATVLEGGALLIGQPNEVLIRVYDADGSFVRTIGGPGEGPGEIGVLDAFGVDADGLWVLDLGNSRLTRFRLDGTFVRDETWRRWSEVKGEDGVFVYGSYGFALGADGLGVARPGMAVMREFDPFVYGQFPIRRVGPDGEMFDTVLTTPVPYDPDVPDGHYAPIASGPLHAVARDGDGALWVDRDPDGAPTRGLFRVARVNARGDTLFDRTYGYEPRRVDARAERARIEDALPAIVARYEGQIWVPDTEPPVGQLVATTGGLVWISREPSDGVTPWWGLDPETGDIEAVIELAAGERILDQAGTELITTFEDELSVPYVRRYRIG
jgi:hypothetical protein